MDSEDGEGRTGDGLGGRSTVDDRDDHYDNDHHGNDHHENDHHENDHHENDHHDHGLTDGHLRVVADADVLVADLLVGGPSRDALDHLRSHSWLSLVATPTLLADAEALVADLADAELAADWRDRVDAWAAVVDQPEGDHPALAAAYRGDALHVLTLDEQLRGAEAGANLRGIMDVSVRSPEAFAAVFDPAAVYEARFDEPYPGPDLDPRA